MQPIEPYYTSSEWAPGILADWQIEALLPLLPFSDRTIINGLSYGLSYAGYDIRIAENLILYPGDFALASSVERFNMPGDVVAVVHDKSSYARRGIAAQNTILEPNWRGTLTLELTNHSNLRVHKDSPYAHVKISETVRFSKGDPVAQIVFHKMSARPRSAYNGKYQDQEAGPQAARFE